jgi:hypothetical protein
MVSGGGGRIMRMKTQDWLCSAITSFAQDEGKLRFYTAQGVDPGSGKNSCLPT